MDEDDGTRLYKLTLDYTERDALGNALNDQDARWCGVGPRETVWISQTYEQAMKRLREAQNRVDGPRLCRWKMESGWRPTEQ
jgi:hypothetical protein